MCVCVTGSYPVAPCLWCVGVGGSPAGGWLWAGAGGSFRQNPPNRPHSSAEQRQSHSRQIHTAKLRVDAARMWVSQTLLSLLLLMATSEGYYSELYPMPVGFMANDDTVSIPVREPKSGIFWTGRRYSRRGSSEETKKKVKTRAESRFVIGSRYGKRTDVVPLDFGSNLCKFTSFHPLYPCSNR